MKPIQSKTRIKILQEACQRCTNEFFTSRGNRRMCLSLVGNILGRDIGTVETLDDLDNLDHDPANAGGVIFSALNAIIVAEKDYGSIDWLHKPLAEYLSKLPNFIKIEHAEDYEKFEKYFGGNPQ